MSRVPASVLFKDVLSQRMPQRYGALDWMGLVRGHSTCVSMLCSAPGEAPVIWEAFRILPHQCLLCAQFLGVKEWELAPQLLPRILCPCMSRIVLVSKSNPPNPFLPTQPASPRRDIFQFSQAAWRLSLSHPVSQHARLCPSLSPGAVSLCSREKTGPLVFLPAC